MRLAEGVFVTGTDTDVGKSVVTAALASALRHAGIPVRALKPVASGVPSGLPGEDAALLGRAAGHAPASLVRLVTPVSPHRAANLEGVAIDAEALLRWIRENSGRVTLVEGAGGWEVPITPHFRMSQLARALGWPVLVVARNKLGVLNHTLLTVEAIRHRGLVAAGVVLVGDAGDPSCAHNAHDLAEALGDVAVRTMPWLPDLEDATLAAAGAALLRM
jgi:dethiobiotin synthetase